MRLFRMGVISSKLGAISTTLQKEPPVKPRSIAISVLILLAVLAGALFLVKKSSYTIVKPERGDITEAVYGLGKVKSEKRYQVIVGVISTVSRRFVNEGEVVKKGQPLIEFDSQALFRAPFNGTVTMAAIDEGETALPHVPQLRVEDLSDLYLELSLEQQAAIRVKKGQAAKLSFESVRGTVFKGSVTSLYSREDEFLARIDVEGLPDGVLPGMTADVTVEIGQIKNALLVPLKAVLNGMVTVRRNGRWEKVKVDIGHIDGLSAEVKGGPLTEADEIRMGN